MASEDPFRIALLAVFVLILTVGVPHRLRAKSGERISWTQEGPFMFVSLSIAGIGLWIIVLVYLINPAWMQWASVPLPDWLRWSGAALGILGAPLLYWTLANLGKNLTNTVVTRANATLVTTGPYRWIRHPFYVVAGLMMAGASLLSANWFIALDSLAVITLLAVRTSHEEQNLIEKFGDDYRAYMAATGRFFPKRPGNSAR